MPRCRIRHSRCSAALAALTVLSGSMLVPVPVAGAPNSVRLVVTFRAGTPDAVADRVAGRAGKLVDRIEELRVRVVEVPNVAAEHVSMAWRQNPRVQQVERDGLMAATWLPSDPAWPNQWEQRQVRAPRAWNVERGTHRTVVAVVDTGVQLTHPDLSGRLVSGYNILHPRRLPRDDNGHGTSVAGVIAATANSLGVVGMCMRCRIMPVKVLDANGNGWWTDAAKGIIWAADHHADVINLSFGGASGGSTLGDAVAYARSRGAVVVAAAGNSDSRNLFYPAAYPGVISVAASTRLDLRYEWSDFSNSWVDVAAPGCTWATKRGSNYGSFCGTSAATPVVSGIAALMDSARPGIPRSTIEWIVKAAAIRTPWAFTRFGRVDAYRAVYRAVRGKWPTTPQLQPSAPLPDDVTMLAGTYAGYRFDVDGAIVGSRSLVLSADVAVRTTSLAHVPDRKGSWFYLVDGGLAEYWVRSSKRVFLTPDPTPTPLPSPSLTPTPTATATP